MSEYDIDETGAVKLVRLSYNIEINLIDSAFRKHI